jgi:hypothetical protein
MAQGILLLCSAFLLVLPQIQIEATTIDVSTDGDSSIATDPVASTVLPNIEQKVNSIAQSPAALPNLAAVNPPPNPFANQIPNQFPQPGPANFWPPVNNQDQNPFSQFQHLAQGFAPPGLDALHGIFNGGPSMLQHIQDRLFPRSQANNPWASQLPGAGGSVDKDQDSLVGFKLGRFRFNM